MNIGVLDILCLVFLVLCFLVGFRKGGIYSILRLIVVAVSFVAAYLLHPHLRGMLDGFLNYTSDVDTIVFSASFLVVSFVANGFLGRFINAFSGSESMSMLYKVVGGILEAFQGIFYAGAILLLLAAASDTMKARSHGVVSAHAKAVVGKTYESMNKIIRKQDIGPVLNNIENIL